MRTSHAPGSRGADDEAYTEQPIVITFPPSAASSGAEELMSALPPAALSLEASFLHWRDALATWLHHLDSPSTRRNYRASLESFFQRPAMGEYLEDVAPAHLNTWRGELVARVELLPEHPHHLSPNTVNRHLAAARTFFTFWRAWNTEQHRYVPFSAQAQTTVLKPLRSQVKRPYAILEPAERTAMLEAAILTGAPAKATITTSQRVARKTWVRVYKGQDTLLAQRDRAILVVALVTGLRIDELHQLEVRDLSPKGDHYQLDVRSGKGKKSRTVWMRAEEAEVVLEYLAASGRNFAAARDRATPLWLSRRGTRLTTGHLRRIIDAIADLAQAQGQIALGKTISPHSARHTVAMSLFTGDPKQGRPPASIMQVARWLGHGDIGTTQGYLNHLSDDELQALAVAVLPPALPETPQQESKPGPA